MHPALRELSGELSEDFGRGNIPHPLLQARVDGYRNAIDKELDQVDFSLLYIEGVRLANAERASAADPELPPLDASVRERLESLLRLHGTFVMATAEGMEAIAAEERYQRRPEEEKAYRAAAMDFAESLQDRPDIIETKAATVVLGAATQINQGTNPERSGVTGTGTLQNVAITLVSGATVMALPLAGVMALGWGGAIGAGLLGLLASESLKKSKAFAAVIQPVTRTLDRLSEAELAKERARIRKLFGKQLIFVRTIEQRLRRLAVKRDELSWITAALDWISANDDTADRDAD
jgi:hypothetical protein